MSQEIDKVLVSILQRRLKSITEEMSIALTMTTRSPILCEAKDFVTGLYDAKGKMLEQTENLPILSFSLGPVCEYIVQYFGDEIYPGDVIFHNDVFSMGNQNNDVAAYKPIFHEDTLVGWAACKGHQADIGGAVQGRVQSQCHRGLGRGAPNTSHKGLREGQAAKRRMGSDLRQYPAGYRRGRHAG